MGRKLKLGPAILKEKRPRKYFYLVILSECVTIKLVIGFRHDVKRNLACS